MSMYRFTESDVADIDMALEMYWVSPDGQAHYEAFMASLPDATMELSGVLINLNEDEAP
jgi:hypothetical protein